jgi:uncharacterized membrane protein YhhN
VTWALLAAALTFGILHIHADYRREWTRTYIFKPLAMIGIIGLVFVDTVPDNPYRWWILTGLLFSLAGDIFLMLRPARFLAGLASFLLAHLAYIAAFLERMTDLFWPAALMAIAAGLAMLAILRPGLGPLKLPVVLYVAAIVAMVATAVSAAAAAPTPGRVAAAAGALLFLVSDACLGYARFRRRYTAAQPTILGSYYPAQALMALSAGALYA